MPTGLIAVARREVRWIWHDRLALFFVVGVPLLCFALLSFTFSHAVVRDLRVDVVDRDFSETSTLYIQALNAAPGVAVTRRSTDLNGAMQAVRSGDAIATVYLPRYLERDIAAGKRPQIVIFHNKQFYSPGNIASGALSSAIAAGTAALPASKAAGGYTPGPLVVEQYVLTNPALNYAQFLLRAILPTVLHVVIAGAAGYAVGSEFGRRNRVEWLETAGGFPLVALVGKLAPYFGIFLLMIVVDSVIMHSGFQIPFRGNSAVVGAAAALFIIAYMSIGALFQLLVRNLPLGLALTAILCSPAFGYAGVGFPVLAMGDFARVWGALLPLRWFIEVVFDQAARGLPAAASAEPFAALTALAVVFFGLCLWRLRVIARSPAPVPAPPPAPNPGRPGLVGAFVAEYRRVIGDKGAFGLFVMAPIVYGFLYPPPYLGEIIRAVPIAVVDNDSTELSRMIVQALNASEALQVAVRADTLAEAQEALQKSKVFGILDIPAGTERDMLAGRPARLPAYVDSAYFLLYNRTLQGILDATGAATTELLSRDARPDGSLARSALAKRSPIELINQPLYNPVGGYGSTIVPTAFILILQQTLLMGAATLGGVAFEQGGHGARRRRGAAVSVVGQALAHLLAALPGATLFMVLLPRVYGFAATSHFLDLLAMAIPFILAVSFLGQFVGTWFSRRETAVILLMATGLPLLFLAGVSWPVEAIPPSLRLASFAIPSTSAIDGLVRINQMGARIADVLQDWTILWALAAIYGLLAIVATRLVTRGTDGRDTAKEVLHAPA